MNKSLLTLSAVCLLIVASCKKDKGTEPEEQSKTCQLTESSFIATGGDTEKATFAYDEQGRVKTVTYSDGSTDSYSYSTTQIVLTASGNVVTTYKLDGNGRITSESYNDDPSKINYTYNNNGYLAEETEVFSSSTSTTKYTYTGENLTLVDFGTEKIVVSYSTETATANFFTETDDDLPASVNGVLKSYFGKPSKNLVSKATYDGGYAESYTYEKDANGNLTKISVNATGGQGYILTNKYSCK